MIGSSMVTVLSGSSLGHWSHPDGFSIQSDQGLRQGHIELPEEESSPRADESAAAATAAVVVAAAPVPVPVIAYHSPFVIN